jgi:hypothetical protein
MGLDGSGNKDQAVMCVCSLVRAIIDPSTRGSCDIITEGQARVQPIYYLLSLSFLNVVDTLFVSFPIYMLCQGTNRVEN